MRRVAGLNYRTLALVVGVVVLAGVVLGTLGVGALAAPVDHSPSAHSSPAARASPTTAAQGQKTTTILIGLVYTPGLTFPGNVTFYTNITWGDITNSATSVAVIANGSTGHFAAATGNGSVVSSGVTSFTSNGVPYQNYTWTVFTNKTSFSPNCADASCADIIGGSSGVVSFTVWVLEKGASAGGGTAVQTYSWGQPMVSTSVTVGFLEPSTDDATGTTYAQFVPMNMSVSFWVNTSYVALSNATQDVWMAIAITSGPTPTAAISFNNTLNYTVPYTAGHPAGQSGSITANGTTWTGWWANVTYSTTLNATTLGYSSWAAMVAALGPGTSLSLTVGAAIDGTTAGGITLGATSVYTLSTATGTTAAIGGNHAGPVPYQPLPFTQTGWLNLTYVSPDFLAHGNASYTAYFQLWDGATVIHTYNGNNSVNTTNPDGVSLSAISNGTTALGGTWVNYTWSITIGVADISSSAYGDTLVLTVNLTVNGVGGAWALFALPTSPVLADTFVQHPTTVATTFTTPVSGYIDVSAGTNAAVNWTLSVTNGTITPAVTSLELQVVDATIPYPIMNYTIAVVPGQTNYSFPLTPSTFTSCDTQVCGVTSPNDDFYFTVLATENGIGGPMNGSLATSTASIGPAFFIGTPATISLISPSGAAPVLATGNITFVTFYSGQYVAGANLTVLSGTVTVFTALMTQLTAGVPAHAVWDATAAGTYAVSVSMSRTSGPAVFDNITLTVLSSAAGVVWSNSSTYHNVTLLGHLSPAVAGTILLLVGLIVGMIVALLVGRMMWGGGAKPQEAPQQWEPGQTSSGTGGAEAGGTSTDPGSGSMDSGSPPSGSS
jgi:hypothetical protein